MGKHLPRLVLGLLALLPSCGGGTEPARPNVVLVVVDTLRADHMSLYGHPRATTPHLERLAEQAWVFERASAGSSWTLPSMAMLFSGRYTPDNVWRVDPTWTPFPERFHEAGYRTGAVVTNVLLGAVERTGSDGSTVTSASGFERGFDHYQVFEPPVPPPGMRLKQRPHGWHASEVVERGTGWVEATDTAGAPYLMWLHLFDPHHPRRPSRPDRFEPEGLDRLAHLPPELLAGLTADDRAWIASELAFYDSEVAAVDEAMAELFAWLEERGELDETIVVLTSDHGEGLWQRPLPAGENPKDHNKVPALYSDHGIQLYDEQVRVPLVLWAPGLSAGRRVGDPVSLVDLVPTLYELADLAPPDGGEELSGLSLVGDLSGREELYAFCTRSSTVTVDGRWRLHLPAEYRLEKGWAVPELFDLEADPLELSPVDDPERVAAMSARLRDVSRLLAPSTALSPEEQAARRELLDAMGYTGQ